MIPEEVLTIATPAKNWMHRALFSLGDKPELPLPRDARHAAPSGI